MVMEGELLGAVTLTLIRLVILTLGLILGSEEASLEIKDQVREGSGQGN